MVSNLPFGSWSPREISWSPTIGATGALGNSNGHPPTRHHLLGVRIRASFGGRGPINKVPFKRATGRVKKGQASPYKLPRTCHHCRSTIIKTSGALETPGSSQDFGHVFGFRV